MSAAQRLFLSMSIVIVATVGGMSTAWVLDQWTPLHELPKPPDVQAEQTVDYVLAPVDLLLSQRSDPNMSKVKERPAFWAPSPGSPLMLLPIEEALKYVPTEDSLCAWVANVDELKDIEVKWNSDLRYLWGSCQELMALYSFILDHQYREQDRWQNREQSVSLEAELGSVRAFMDRQLGHDAEVWRLISLYSDEVAAGLRDSGEGAADGDDPASCWVLFSALIDAGAPSFDSLVETMRNSK